MTPHTNLRHRMKPHMGHPQAVKHLHDHNLIHLDIKPENVFVNYDDVCKLGDFGLVLNLNEVIIFLSLTNFVLLIEYF